MLREGPGDGDGDGVGPGEDLVEDADLEEERDPEKALFCASCEAEITAEKHRRNVDGKFEHCFTNPAGILYCIGCFDEAPGVVPFGDETDEFTWFPGYAWQIVLCGSCHAQLGWRYWREGDGFYGLILKRLS
jgi:hypothetical protein